MAAETYIPGNNAPHIDSKESVPAGHIASIITHLEMRAAPAALSAPDSPLQLKRWRDAAPDRYAELFRTIGAPWLWFSRLVLDQHSLAALLKDPLIMLHTIVDKDGAICGMLELDFRVQQQCEIMYLGLTPEYAGQGHGKWLMAEALRLAWGGPEAVQGEAQSADAPPAKAACKDAIPADKTPGKTISRVWLRTCTLDHPAALGFYRKYGFVPICQEVEIYPDPRLTGHLPRDAAPQIPIIA